MKTKLITGLKKELFLVELPENTKSWEYIDGHFFIDNKKTFIKGFTPFHKLLGTPDEIKESDVVDLVVSLDLAPSFSHNKTYYHDYKNNDYGFKTALESFHSALESEIYWDVNPMEKPKETNLNSSFFDMQVSFNQEVRFDEAESRTFNRNRTLIFVKN